MRVMDLNRESGDVIMYSPIQKTGEVEQRRGSGEGEGRGSWVISFWR